MAHGGHPNAPQHRLTPLVVHQLWTAQHIPLKAHQPQLVTHQLWNPLSAGASNPPAGTFTE